MAEILTDICVIGAGAGGLSVAAGAAQMGARVVLIERHRMGGDCLWTGCVPSKALLAAAVRGDDFTTAMKYVKAVIAGIEPHDSQDRFEGLGVRILRADARFAGPADVIAGADRVRAKYVVIATGSVPTIPAIPGLAELPFLTTDSLFDLESLPAHLVILGGGPVGVEMAQAFRGLGAAVTIVEADRLLGREDADLVDPLKDRLRADGVEVVEGATVARAEGPATLHLADGGVVAGSRLLVATGRKPVTDGLDLEAAGIKIGATGIETDARLRTSNRRVFAIGDAAGPPYLTHRAGAHAGIVIRNVLFRLPAKADDRFLPRVTYSDPEVATVGRSLAYAGPGARALDAAFADNDRARTEGETAGFARLVIDGKGKLVGAACVGPQAGELIAPVALALQAGLKLRDLAGFIAPYPTRHEVWKRAAGAYYTPQLFSERTRRLVRLLLKLP